MAAFVAAAGDARHKPPDFCSNKRIVQSSSQVRILSDTSCKWALVALEAGHGLGCSHQTYLQPMIHIPELRSMTDTACRRRFIYIAIIAAEGRQLRSRLCVLHELSRGRLILRSNRCSDRTGARWPTQMLSYKQFRGKSELTGCCFLPSCSCCSWQLKMQIINDLPHAIEQS